MIFSKLTHEVIDKESVEVINRTRDQFLIARTMSINFTELYSLLDFSSVGRSSYKFIAYLYDSNLRSI